MIETTAKGMIEIIGRIAIGVVIGIAAMIVCIWLKDRMYNPKWRR